jgi:hypothetical protein
MKGVCKLKAADMKGKCASSFAFFFERGGGAAGGSGRAVGFADIPVRL